MLYREFPETHTQAYQAGVICSMIHNTYPDENLPSFIPCVIKFYALRELFGERMWQKIRAKSNFRERVALYESLEYQPGRSRLLVGTAEEFALGYIKSYENSKRKLKKDKALLSVINSLS